MVRDGACTNHRCWKIVPISWQAAILKGSMARSFDPFFGPVFGIDCWHEASQ